MIKTCINIYQNESYYDCVLHEDESTAEQMATDIVNDYNQYEEDLNRYLEAGEPRQVHV